MGQFQFESLSQANYKRMTLISKVSSFEMIPVPVWNEETDAVILAVSALFSGNIPQKWYLHKVYVHIWF